MCVLYVLKYVCMYVCTPHLALSSPKYICTMYVSMYVCIWHLKYFLLYIDWYPLHSVRGSEIDCSGVRGGQPLHRGLRLARPGQGAKLAAPIVYIHLFKPFIFVDCIMYAGFGHRAESF